VEAIPGLLRSLAEEHARRELPGGFRNQVGAERADPAALAHRDRARARELEPEYQQAKSKIAYFEEIQARNAPWQEVNEKIASAFESVGDADRRFQGVGGTDEDGDNSQDSVSWWKATSQAHWQNALAWRSFAQDIGTQLAELKVEHRCTAAPRNKTIARWLHSQFQG